MKTKKTSNSVLLILMGLAIGFLNGVFGSGGGIIAVLLMTHVLKMENKMAHATSISIILPLSFISSIVLLKNGYYDLELLLKVAIGSILGGIVGAKLLNKISNTWIRRVFGIVMIISAVRMVV